MTTQEDSISKVELRLFAVETRLDEVQMNVARILAIVEKSSTNNSDARVALEELLKVNQHLVEMISSIMPAAQQAAKMMDNPAMRLRIAMGRKRNVRPES